MHDNLGQRGFMVAGNERQFAVQNYHITDSDRNASVSISAGDLDYLACDGGYLYKENMTTTSLSLLCLPIRLFRKCCIQTT